MVGVDDVLSKLTTVIDPDLKKDIVSISAGNYGGKLGQYHFHLRKIMK